MSSPQKAFIELLRQDRRYKAEAYQFVWESLNFAQEKLKLGRAHVSEPARPGEHPGASGKAEKHVTGQELCQAIRQYALRQYGLMAKTVLNSWGVYRTSDFGEIVFNLILAKQMRKTPQDTRSDFDNVYDFDQAFRKNFHIQPPV